MPDLHALGHSESQLKLAEYYIAEIGRVVHPHRYIFLIAIANLIKEKPQRENRFPFTDDLAQEYERVCIELVGNDSQSSLEYPYYHLGSSCLWRHILNPDMESKYNEYKRFTPKRIREIIRYATLEESLFEKLKSEKFRDVFVGRLKERIMNLVSHRETKDAWNDTSVTNSMFPHEEYAIRSIIERLANKVNFVPNYNLHNTATNEYLECDMVAVSRVGLFIIELKHWAGEIEIRHHNWLRNQSENWKDPHISNQHKCKVLRSLCEKIFPTIKISFIKSLVVLTNPEATVYNADSYRCSKPNATFAGIEKLVKYFNWLFGEGNWKLDNNQVGKITERLRKDLGKSQPKKFTIPGYEVLEDLTSSSDIIEVLARQSDVSLQTIQRLRVHTFPSAALSSPSQIKELKWKAINGLHALEAVGDHPNILKVWTVPHPDGLIIEASDWTTDGTLRDVMGRRDVPIPVKEAMKIARGILTGLSICHEHGVVHRNLKPENILIREGSPRLSNFDYAYLIEDERYTVLPELQRRKRSPYVAPEIQTGGAFSDASDLFSVGVILYELLCGELPFDNSLDLQNTGGGLVGSHWDKLREEGVPDEVQVLLDELIQFDPNKRPTDAREVIKSLEGVSDEAGSTTTHLQNRVLEEGESCGIYEIIGLIGQGREAQVYKAKQGSDRIVVLKLFHLDVPRERAAREKDNLKRIHSPYAVKVETPNQWHDGRYFLVLDYIDGLRLRDFIDAQERPSIRDFRHVCRCLLSLLEEMHEDSQRQEPLLHNDIKPDNIVLTEDKTPIVIDFSTSGPPRIAAYTGTPVYSAPDLLEGAEFYYSESSDLFSLGVTLFEWLAGTRPYKGVPNLLDPPLAVESIREDLDPQLIEWLNKAVQPKREDRFQSVSAMMEAFEQKPGDHKEAEKDWSEIQHEPSDIEVRVEVPIEASIQTCRNKFVSYLNTLHNLTATNVNALAESQALSEFFSAIHVPSHATDFIEGELTKGKGHHVILTGHAGDGKSTIALEIFKRLKGYDPASPLSQPLQEIEDIELSSGLQIRIVKDMSELAAEERKKCILEACQRDSLRRWLIVSNSGTLLNTILQISQPLGKNELEVENRILKALEKDVPDSLEDLGFPITVINLARVDNITTARKLMERLVVEDLWRDCETCQITDHCPIYINVNALRETLRNSSMRIERIYRLLYGYGSRLTMRQMSGHLAYALTAGLDCEEIIESVKSGVRQNIEGSLFFNRFFGFKGNVLDPEAGRLAATRTLLKWELGSKPYLPLEQRLWSAEHPLVPVLPKILQPTWDSLHKTACAGVNSVNVSSEQARPQLRRMLYFFAEFPNDLDRFFSHFTCSPMLFEFETWQNEENLARPFRSELKTKVLQVLQEHFTGMQFPEMQPQHDLFITLKRSQQALRQSSQILLAKIPLDHFQIRLEPINHIFGPKRYRLILEDTYRNEHLHLDLPFLDFVMLRHEGEMGQGLNMAFLDRLDRFKGALLERYGPKNRDRSSELEVLQRTLDDQIVIRKLFLEGDIVRVS
jgi:serine/threonine protein kinase